MRASGLTSSVDPFSHHPSSSLPSTALPLFRTSPNQFSLSQPQSFCKAFPIALALPTLSPSLHFSYSPLSELSPAPPTLPALASLLCSVLILSPSRSPILPSSLLWRRPLPSLRLPSSPLPSGPRHWLLSPPPARDVKAPPPSSFSPSSLLSVGQSARRVRGGGSERLLALGSPRICLPRALAPPPQ